jgi:flagellar biosynthesis protein FlhG
LILIDTGAGVSPNVLGLASAADQLLVVTTPEPTSITDAYAVIKTMHARDARPDICILVNMVHDVSEGREVFHRLDEVCRRYLRLSTRYVGHVMFDQHVSQAVRAQKPFLLAAPSCPASFCIDQLARRMARHGAAACTESLWHRLSQWLVT